jgi:probable F420-dependent oxidoreductase
MPVTGQEDYPSGGDVAWIYRSFYDPFTTLGAAAAVTERLLLGTSVILLPQRDAILTAKEVATVDVISGGRAVLGVGAGWNREEMGNHGTVFRTRFTKMREQVEALREIWTKDAAEYHGTIVDFDPIHSWPKPVQQPLPVLIGGTGPKTLDRVVAYGDGWIPPLNWFDGDPAKVAEKIAELAGKCAEAGRPNLPVTVMGVRGKADLLMRLADMGVDRAVISLPAAGADEILPRLDHYLPLLTHTRG